MKAKVKYCTWFQDGDSDTWSTGCGNYFSINAGTPAENHFKFCAYCGKHLQECPYVPEEDEDEEADD